jgi:hypothetical protein
MTGTVDADAGGVRKPMISLAEYATRFGSRTAHGANPEMYDFAEFYFKEGGAELFVARTADNTDGALTAALATFARDLGPGQVVAPARVTPAQRLILANHAVANNRIAISATTNTNNVATLTAEATIAGITVEAERYIALFGPWLTVPGTTPGTTRTISPEAIVCGLMALNDGSGVSQNQPAAGALGISEYGIAVTHSFSDADRATLNSNGVNLLRGMYDAVRVYGYRTLADPTNDPNWVNLGNARLFMAIQALFDEAAERFVFRELDGQRRTISEFGGILTGILLPFWQRGSLYGATPEEAFRVDVGPNVNTEATIANRELRANVRLRTSEYAEEVVLELVKTRTTEAL